MQPLADFSRLSLNQITTQRWTLREAVEGCGREAIPAIGLWREKVAEVGLKESHTIVRDAGLHVSCYCRGGWFAAPTAAGRQQRLDDNRRAIDEAAALNAGMLVLVCGPAPDRDIAAGRAMVVEGIAAIVPYAQQCGVRLGIEPLHPMYAAERSVVVTLAQALSIAEQFDPAVVGVLVDVYHVWWDPDLYTQIRRAAGRIAGFHVSDWLVPTPDLLHGRGMMGDGVIEIRRIRSAVDGTGYDGFIEVEIFNRAIWEQPGDQVLALVKQRYRTCV
jgi:sugar phosphate isomerase/epimerase